MVGRNFVFPAQLKNAQFVLGLLVGTSDLKLIASPCKHAIGVTHNQIQPKIPGDDLVSSLNRRIINLMGKCFLFLARVSLQQPESIQILESICFIVFIGNFVEGADILLPVFALVQVHLNPVDGQPI